jgi:hypothetical protein
MTSFPVWVISDTTSTTMRSFEQLLLSAGQFESLTEDSILVDLVARSGSEDPIVHEGHTLRFLDGADHPYEDVLGVILCSADFSTTPPRNLNHVLLGYLNRVDIERFTYVGGSQLRGHGSSLIAVGLPLRQCRVERRFFLTSADLPAI